MKDKAVIHGSVKSYSLGFVLSLVLTMLAYWLITGHHLNRGLAITAILVLAVAQLVVQLWFFLHLGSEPKPRWNQLVLFFAVGVVVILVVGSVWIMYHLNYNMTPQGANHYLIKEENINK
jgi:cytochrome o ubiquinol oxidase operon protein cyoD